MAMKNLTIYWVGATSAGLSETFIKENLDVCREIGIIQGVSGALEVGLPDEYQIRASGFAFPKEYFFEKVWRKLFKYPLYYDRTNSNFKRSCLSEIQEIRGGIIFFEFAFSAVMVQKSLSYLGSPFVIQVHGVDVSAMFELEGYKERFLLAAKESAAIICPSEHIKRLCILAGVDSKKLEVVFNSRNPDQIINAANEVPTSFPSFVHLGRLTPKKNPLATLEAFRIVHSEFQDAKLTFIGGGELKSVVEERIQDYKLEGNVVLAGEMPHDDALKLMSSHWIYCQHSVTSRQGDSEGMPVSIAEASLLGMPIVSTYHNGIPEEVIHGETGFLVKEFDYETMAVCMAELARDERLRVKFGKAGIRKARAMGSPQRRKEELHCLFEKILGLNANAEKP